MPPFFVLKFFEVSKLSFKKVLSGVWGKPHKEKECRDFFSTLIGGLFLLFDKQMSVRKTVDIFRAVSFGNAFGIDSDNVVRLESLDRFDLGKKPAVVLIEQACEEQISRRLDIVFRFIGMVDLREKHAEVMVVRHVLGNCLEAGLLYLVCLIAEDEFLVFVCILHGSLHRCDLGVSLRDRFDNVLLFVGIICACVSCVKLEEV